MVLGPIGYLFSFRRKVYLLRKKYDRAREKADKIKDRNRRLTVLKMLDHVQPALVMLEEQQLSRFESRRMLNNIKVGIAEAEDVMHGEYPSSRHAREDE